MDVAEQAGVPEGWPKQHGVAGAATWTAVTTAILVAVSVILALTLRSAFLFVSIGPIIYELIQRPLARASSPRSTIVANVIALAVGYGALAAFGLLHHPSSVQEGVTLARAGAVVSAVAVTGALVVLLHVVHPPAGSTLLLVTLGVMHQPVQLACIFATIVIVTAVGWCVNRAVGIPVPVWSASQPSPYGRP